MGCTTAGEVQALSLPTLTAKFGEKAGLYMWRAVRGWHDEPVQEKGISKSMLAAKSFPETFNRVALRRWLSILSLELAKRMLLDFSHNSRRPRTLHLYYRGSSVGDRSKSTPMPPSVAHIYAQEALSSPSQSTSISKDITNLHDSSTDQLNGTSLVNPLGVSSNDTSSQISEKPVDKDHVLCEDETCMRIDHGLDRAENVVGQVDSFVEGAENSVEVDDHGTATLKDGGHSEGQSTHGEEESANTKALAEILTSVGMKLLEKAEGALPCSRLAMSATEFVDVQAQGIQSLQKFFTAAPKADVMCTPTSPPSLKHMPKPHVEDKKGIRRFLQTSQVKAPAVQSLVQSVDDRSSSGTGQNLEISLPRFEESSCPVTSAQQTQVEGNESDMERGNGLVVSAESAERDKDVINVKTGSSGCEKEREDVSVDEAVGGNEGSPLRLTIKCDLAGDAFPMGDYRNECMGHENVDGEDNRQPVEPVRLEGEIESAQKVGENTDDGSTASDILLDTVDVEEQARILEDIKARESVRSSSDVSHSPPVLRKVSNSQHRKRPASQNDEGQKRISSFFSRSK